MRKQYHLLRVGDRFDAWDVARLVELSADLPTRNVPLTSIQSIDDAYWFQDDSQPPTVRAVVEHMRLINDVDAAHPIILGADGRVMDGMHRVAKALLDGDSTISAVQFETDPEPDYRGCRPADLPYD